MCPINITGLTPQQSSTVMDENPVSLNIATPKNAGWKYFKESTTSQHSPASTSGVTASKKVVTGAQSALTLDHFIDFMTHDRSNSSGADCSLGWLPAMNTLHRQLLQDDNSPRDIRIGIEEFRYEQFERPNPLCRALFAFVMDSNSSREFVQTAAKVCDVFFPLAVPRASVSTHADSGSARNNNFRPASNNIKNKGSSVNPNRSGHPSRKLAVDHSSNTTDEHRVLRLRNYQDTKTFNFLPELVTTVGQERVQEFLFASQRTLRAQQRVVDDIEHRLSVFGYSLKEWRRRKGASGNVFSQWELDV
eukprot:gene22152-28259_t